MEVREIEQHSTKCTIWRLLNKFSRKLLTAGHMQTGGFPHQDGVGPLGWVR